jgi:hypothetical protein
VDLDSFSIADSFSSPLFNDLHHVNIIGDFIYVVSTGIDEVIKFTLDFEFVERFAMGNGEILSRFGPDSDFRLVPYTKPHEEHPNFITDINGQPFVTCLKSGTIQSLYKKDVIKISDDPIHDGIKQGDELVFTAVTGKIISLNTTNRTLSEHNMNTSVNNLKPLGWCRGIDVVSPGKFTVAFSKLRQTPNRENISILRKWSQHMKTISGLPSRITEIDVNKGTIKDLFTVNSFGIDAIFSIHLIKS